MQLHRLDAGQFGELLLHHFVHMAAEDEFPSPETDGDDEGACDEHDMKPKSTKFHSHGASPFEFVFTIIARSDNVFPNKTLTRIMLDHGRTCGRGTFRGGKGSWRFASS